MTYDYTTDPRMLAAGNARGLAGGDRDAMPVSPTAGRVVGSTGVRPAPAGTRAIGAAPTRTRRPNPRARITDDDLTGDLTANAARLGVPVADLVRLHLNRPRGLRRLFR